MRLTLEEVVRVTGGRIIGSAGAPGAVVTGVTTDTRSLRKGDLFVALRGPRADGHDFIPDAFRKGAAAVLTNRPLPRAAGGPLVEVQDGLRALADLARFYRRTLPVTVVGVTGSVGKTTTVKMCAAVLGVRFHVKSTRDDWNAEIGVPLTILGLQEADQVTVIEMAMRGRGQIAELVDIAQPMIGVVTNVGDAHLELLGSRENIAKAKEELIAGLARGGTAVLNVDDLLVSLMRPLRGGTVLTYGLGPGAYIRAREIRHDRDGVGFALAVEGGTEPVRLRTWGQHNVMNALAATGVGLAMGMTLHEIATGLEKYVPPKMRLQPVPLGDVLVINDAYNASPASMDAAFEVLAEVGHGRRTVAVLGEMKELGPESPRLHREVGVSLARWRAAVLVTVEQGGRQIAEGALAAGMPSEAVIHLPSVDAAAERVRGLVRPGDVVLVKGSRALEMERIVDALVEARR